MLRRLLVGLAALGMAGAASAQVTYTYTGNNFLYIGGCCGVSHVSGSFTVSSALSGSTSFANIAGMITDYSFSDGRNTWTTGNYPGGPTSPFNRSNEFAVSTDAFGNIDSWRINIVSNAPIGLITTQSLSYAAGGDLLDGVNVYNNYVAYSYAPGNPNGQQGVSGTWSVTTPVPEPETYALLLAGLGLLGFHARRRKAKLAV